MARPSAVHADVGGVDLGTADGIGLEALASPLAPPRVWQLTDSSEESLYDAIRLRLADEDVTRGDAPEPGLPLEGLGHEVAALVVAEREAAGRATRGMARLLADGHGKRLGGLRLGAVLACLVKCQPTNSALQCSATAKIQPLSCSAVATWVASATQMMFGAVVMAFRSRLPSSLRRARRGGAGAGRSRASRARSAHG